MANGADEPTWNGGGGGRSPGRGGPGGDPPRRSSRSRSPRRDDRGRSGANTDGVNQNPGNNLHVSGLSSRVDTRDLEAAFAKIGRVQKASVMYDPHTRESRGFGFVTMETAEEADAAITALNATEFMGKTMTVEKARRGRARTPTPGRYYGPPKRHERERFYDPRPYDSRYARDFDHDDRRGGGRGRYDEPPRRDYDRGYRDYDRGDRDRGDRGGYGRDYDRRYDDRRY
ncbi:RNA-binding domain-containing protein [Dentipellis sp. KUC8613]|nr:RNA-binding domain-containing protein [Dentipellis sp. KUC8613]